MPLVLSERAGCRFDRPAHVLTPLALALCIFVGSLAVAPHARAADGAPTPAIPAAELGEGPQPAEAVIPAVDAPQPPDEAAATGQDADAGAIAEEPQQSNVVVIVRVNSPGDDVVSQGNVVAVDASATNRSSTTQLRARAASLLVARAAAVMEAQSARPQSSRGDPHSRPGAGSARAAETPVGTNEHRRRASPQQVATATEPVPSSRPRQVANAARGPDDAPVADAVKPASRAASPRAARSHAGSVALVERLAAPEQPFGRTDAVAAPAVTVGASRDSGLAVATFAALVAGTLAAAASACLPLRRRLRRRAAQA